MSKLIGKAKWKLIVVWMEKPRDEILYPTYEQAKSAEYNILMDDKNDEVVWTWVEEEKNA